MYVYDSHEGLIKVQLMMGWTCDKYGDKPDVHKDTAEKLLRKRLFRRPEKVYAIG
jgi:hypothetical protein